METQTRAGKKHKQMNKAHLSTEGGCILSYLGVKNEYGEEMRGKGSCMYQGIRSVFRELGEQTGNGLCGRGAVLGVVLDIGGDFLQQGLPRVTQVGGKHVGQGNLFAVHLQFHFLVGEMGKGGRDSEQLDQGGAYSVNLREREEEKNE